MGLLVDAWWSPGTNRRTDDWGGDFDNRLRFPWMVLEAIRERVGLDFIVGLRVFIEESVPGGFCAEVGVDILSRLEASGLIDLINVAKGSIHNDVELTDLIPIHGMPAAPMLDFAGTLREATNLLVLHAAKIDDVATSREATMPHDVPLAERARKVVIVGPRPAELEAARVAGERGHKVTVLEAMPWAGGQIQLAIRNPRRKDLKGIIDWRTDELTRLGGDVAPTGRACSTTTTAHTPLSLLQR
jgi:2,4-dienoyl-CoA reductase-like NADH-dependent reductase (Old Yellow Enzyme family)